jgi:hypothetical protein
MSKRLFSKANEPAVIPTEEVLERLEESKGQIEEESSDIANNLQKLYEAECVIKGETALLNKKKRELKQLKKRLNEELRVVGIELENQTIINELYQSLLPSLKHLTNSSVRVLPTGLLRKTANFSRKIIDLTALTIDEVSALLEYMEYCSQKSIENAMIALSAVSNSQEKILEEMNKGCLIIAMDLLFNKIYVAQIGDQILTSSDTAKLWFLVITCLANVPQGKAICKQILELPQLTRQTMSAFANIDTSDIKNRILISTEELLFKLNRRPAEDVDSVVTASTTSDSSIQSEEQAKNFTDKVGEMFAGTIQRSAEIMGMPVDEVESNLEEVKTGSVCVSSSESSVGSVEIPITYSSIFRDSFRFLGECLPFRMRSDSISSDLTNSQPSQSAYYLPFTPKPWGISDEDLDKKPSPKDEKGGKRKSRRYKKSKKGGKQNKTMKKIKSKTKRR